MATDTTSLRSLRVAPQQRSQIMKICVLNDPTWDDPFDPSPYLTRHAWDLEDIHFDDILPRLTELSERGYDVFMNMSDGAADEPDRPGIEVAQNLEALNLPYTGADAGFYDPTRDEMKRVCREHGILTPPGYTFHSVENLRSSMNGLRYPLIVKHPQSYSSVGLTPDSVVRDFDHLQSQVGRATERFHGALVEEFIAGREFSVLVSENPYNPKEPIAFVPLEIVFPSGESFKHEAMKWVRYDEMTCTPVRDPELARRLQDMSIKLFLGLNGVSYGRCDIRMSTSGDLYMLEINAQAAVFYPPEAPGTADHILLNDPRGHQGFLDLLLNAAIARHRRKNGLPWP
jgi:D-alanine-D-alanine ligase